MNKPDLALNNPQWLKYHKSKPNQLIPITDNIPSYGICKDLDPLENLEIFWASYYKKVLNNIFY